MTFHVSFTLRFFLQYFEYFLQRLHQIPAALSIWCNKRWDLQAFSIPGSAGTERGLLYSQWKRGGHTMGQWLWSRTTPADSELPNHIVARREIWRRFFFIILAFSILTEYTLTLLRGSPVSLKRLLRGCDGHGLSLWPSGVCAMLQHILPPTASALASETAQETVNIKAF